MSTQVTIEGERLLINGRPTYEGIAWRGRSLAGLLFNSRMVQALFDDGNPATAGHWRYPDTGVWDAARNTREFCAALPEYRRHGLLAVTVGLQGGGSIYRPDVYDHYECSAFAPDGTLRPAYFDRLRQILAAADACGMVVIVNYFYWKQLRRLAGMESVIGVTAAVSEWLLGTGYRNILVDVINEAGRGWKLETAGPESAARLIEVVQGTSLQGRRLPVGASTLGGDALPVGRWAELEDFSLPHGNGLTAEELRAKLRRFRDSDAFRRRPRPILINEDSVFVGNLEAAAAEGASWGFYCQGYGSEYRDRMDWTVHPRESRYEELSGFQTLPVNWSINTPIKRAFFERLRALTSGRE